MLMLPKTRLQSKNLTNLLPKNIACVKLGILVWFMYSRLVPDTCFAPYLTNLTKNCREQHRPISREVSLRSQRKGHTRIDSSIFVHVQLFNWSRPLHILSTTRWKSPVKVLWNHPGLGGLPPDCNEIWQKFPGKVARVLLCRRFGSFVYFSITCPS